MKGRKNGAKFDIFIEDIETVMFIKKLDMHEPLYDLDNVGPPNNYGQYPQFPALNLTGTTHDIRVSLEFYDYSDMIPFIKWFNYLRESRSWIGQRAPGWDFCGTRVEANKTKRYMNITYRRRFKPYELLMSQNFYGVMPISIDYDTLHVELLCDYSTKEFK